MKTHDLVQGSPEWLAYRSTHFNASDAPAMMGCSPYETRQQLMHRIKTGITPDVDAATQRRFDAGHAIEEKLRGAAESLIGDDLAPLVGSREIEGLPLSASFDGVTLLHDIVWECKTLNAALREAMPKPGHNEAVELPLIYRIQMEHQRLVSGAQTMLFSAGDGEEDERHADYEPDDELAARVLAGWKLFKAELDEYDPAAAPSPTAKVIASAVEALPALVIRVEGRVVSSNLDAYRTAAIARIEAVKTELVTDQDFADADAIAKNFKEGAANLKAAKLAAQAEAKSIDEVFRAVDYIVDLLDKKRIHLENLVKSEKERRKGDIVADGVSGLRDHVAKLNERLGAVLMPPLGAQFTDFGGAIRGKKNLDSMKDAVGTTLANAKIEANRIADLIQANLKHLDDHADHASLFPDKAAIIAKASDDFRALVAKRVADHKAEEARREATKAVEPPAASPAPAPVAAPATSTVRAFSSAGRAAPIPTEKATLTLGVICARFGTGLTMTAAFVNTTLGVSATQDGAKSLYTESDFTAICAALAHHAQNAAGQKAAA